jgi:arabinofuranan 3-O-arabinosyltransferase
MGARTGPSCKAFFAVVRLMGGGASLAWAVHFSFAALIAIVLCALWHSKISYELKAAALATGTLLVTPYLFLYDLVVLAVPMAFLIRIGWSSGFLTGELPTIAFASLLVLIFPLVTAPVGLAAILVVALLIAIRVRHAASGADGLLQYQDQLPSRLEASGGRPRIAVGDL